MNICDLLAVVFKVATTFDFIGYDNMIFLFVCFTLQAYLKFIFSFFFKSMFLIETCFSLKPVSQRATQVFQKLDMNIIRHEQHSRFQKFASRVLDANRVISACKLNRPKM